MLWNLFFREKQAKHFSRPDDLTLQLKRALRSLFYLFNLHTLVLLTLACAAVYVCHREGWSFKMEFGVVAMGTVFPLTFTLAQAFTRRDRATLLIANLKASLVGLYLMHRDWQQAGYTNGQLGNDRQPQAVTAKTILMDLAINIRRYLVCRTPYESLAEARLTAGQDPLLRLFKGELRLSDRSKFFRESVQEIVDSDPAETIYREIYKQLSRLNVLNEKLTIAAGYTRGGEGGMSRTNQYMRFIISNVEEMRTIKLYRTPAMMRHAVAVLVHIFAILLAPYWTSFCSAAGPGVSAGNCPAGYASASAFILVVLLLFHVQQDLEECLTETGLDDVFFVPEELDAHLIGGQQVLCTAPSDASERTHVVLQDGHLWAGYGRLSFQDLAGQSSRFGSHRFGSHRFQQQQEMSRAPTLQSDHPSRTLKPIPSDSQLASPFVAVSLADGILNQAAHAHNDTPNLPPTTLGLARGGAKPPPGGAAARLPRAGSAWSGGGGGEALRGSSSALPPRLSGPSGAGFGSPGRGAMPALGESMSTPFRPESKRSWLSWGRSRTEHGQGLASPAGGSPNGRSPAGRSPDGGSPTAGPGPDDAFSLPLPALGTRSVGGGGGGSPALAAPAGEAGFARRSGGGSPAGVAAAAAPGEFVRRSGGGRAEGSGALSAVIEEQPACEGEGPGSAVVKPSTVQVVVVG